MTWCDYDEGDVGTTEYPGCGGDTMENNGFLKSLKRTDKKEYERVKKLVKEHEDRELAYLLNKGRI